MPLDGSRVQVNATVSVIHASTPQETGPDRCAALDPQLYAQHAIRGMPGQPRHKG